MADPRLRAVLTDEPSMRIANAFVLAYMERIAVKRADVDIITVAADANDVRHVDGAGSTAFDGFLLCFGEGGTKTQVV